MTNLAQNTIKKNVQSHIKKAFVVIDEYLPDYYVSLVKEKMPDAKVSSSMIRKIRSRDPKYKLESQLHIIKALVEVALDHKKKQKQIISLTKKN